MSPAESSITGWAIRAGCCARCDGKGVEDNGAIVDGTHHIAVEGEQPLQQRQHARMIAGDQDPGTTVLAVIVGVASYVPAGLGHSIVLSYQGVSVLWPACAFLASMLLLVPRRTWLVLIPAGLAGFAVNDVQFGFEPGTIALLNLADTIEILIVCLGLGYSFDGVPRLNSSKAFARYCFVAVLLGPFVSAFIVALAMPGSYVVNARVWFFSQALAFLTLTPAILSWATLNYGTGFRGSFRSRLEAVALMAHWLSWGMSCCSPRRVQCPSHCYMPSCPSSYGQHCDSAPLASVRP
jgi:integral membrane sensor domain MASE1